MEKRTRIRLYSREGWAGWGGWGAGGGPDNDVRGGNAGSQNSWVYICVKLGLSALFALILDSVSFRGLPLTSVYNVEPSLPILVGRRQQCMDRGGGCGGGGKAKFTNRYLLKFRAPSASYPNLAPVRFRQPLRASAIIRAGREPESDYILARQTTMYAGGRPGAEATGPIFTHKRSPRFCLS